MYAVNQKLTFTFVSQYYSVHLWMKLYFIVTVV